MERFGGGVKRQAVHNRKLPIEALNNRVRQEEEVWDHSIQEAYSVH